MKNITTFTIIFLVSLLFVMCGKDEIENQNTSPNDPQTEQSENDNSSDDDSSDDDSSDDDSSDDDSSDDDSSDDESSDDDSSDDDSSDDDSSDDDSSDDNSSEDDNEPELTADFSSDKSSITQGDLIQFSDQSAGEPTEWLWEFDGGYPETSDEPYPEIAYLNPGIFQVTLKVTNAVTADTITKSDFISVGDLTEPPYQGTVFLDPNIITPNDPTTYLSIEPTGRGLRTVYDFRVNQWIEINAYLFELTYEGNKVIEAQVNPEFSESEAYNLAEKYGESLGRIPLFLIRDVEKLWIHDGYQRFGGGNNSILIHTQQGDEYIELGVLEEAFVHEGTHTSLDAEYKTEAWETAQRNDPVSISDYGRDFPDREDLAETLVPYLAVKANSNRISKAMYFKILAAIPNRIRYLDDQKFDLYPLSYD